MLFRSLARFGGDEFLILAPDLGSRAAAEGIARRVMAAFAQPFEHDGHQLKISVSIGVAVSDTEEADADLLIRIADAALQGAKEAGRDRYVIGSESASDPAASGWNWRAISASPWRGRSWTSTTSRRSTRRTARCAVWRRSCAGATRAAATSPPPSSCRCWRRRG